MNPCSKAWHLLASESLVSLRGTNQLIIKLLHSPKMLQHAGEKKVIKYYSQVKKKESWTTCYLQLVAKSSLCPPGQLTLSWMALLALIQIFLLINFYDHCHHSMHTITARAIGVGLKKKEKKRRTKEEEDYNPCQYGKKTELNNHGRQVGVHLSAPCTPSILPLYLNWIRIEEEARSAWCLCVGMEVHNLP